MVIALIVWLYITFLSFPVGHYSIGLFKKASKDTGEYHISLVVILGLVIITIISSIISIFYRLSWEANLIFLIFAIVYYILKRHEVLALVRKQLNVLKTLKITTWVLLLISLLTAMVFAAMPTENFDFGLYYMTTIKWISNYAAVPGLGNIHGRLAFNSSWYILSALFSLSFLKSFAFYDVSPYLYLLMSIYGAHGVQRIMKGNVNMMELTKACFVIPVPALLALLDAPATDLAATYFIWLIAIFFLIKIERKTIDQFDTFTILIFLFGAFVCTVKLSAIAIMLIPAYLLLRQWKPMKLKGVSLVVLLCVITIVPWVARNVILSGYLVYPFEKIDIFEVDWKMPIEEVRLESAIVKQYGKYPHLPITQEAVIESVELAGAPFMSWFPNWFFHKSWLRKLILLGLPVGFVCLSIVLMIDLIRNGWGKLSFDAHYIFLFGILLFGTAFCFYLGPSLRYSYGFILFFDLLFFAVAFNAVVIQRFRKFTNHLLTVAILLALFLPIYRCVKIISTDLIPNNFMVFPHVATHDELEKMTFNGFDIYIPKEGYFCWDAPLPCAALPHSGKVYMRTGEIKDGYKFIGPY